MGKSMVSPFVVGNVPERMASHTSYPKHDAPMLHSPVGVKKFGSNRTNPWSGGLLHHDRKPFWSQDFRIIIEKEEVLPVRLTRSSIING